ncbi:hypothetical protein [Streptomyces sp. NPDC096339]|uniref:hypothetical protein n=1 Tax=Streptomyces sp. NPDC096339 TaxID=3366086 RepID=UPI003805EC14
MAGGTARAGHELVRQPNSHLPHGAAEQLDRGALLRLRRETVPLECVGYGVTQPHSELVADNAPVTYQMVRAHIATLRTAPADAPTRPLTVRQVTGRLTRHPTAASQDDRAGLKDVLARCPELDTAAGHVRDFGEIPSDRQGARLPAWIGAVDAGQLPGPTGFALHLLRDLDAVAAGLTLHWNSGSIEGAVNRVKKIKRQLYGRAGFELLRKMILLQ